MMEIRDWSHDFERTKTEIVSNFERPHFVDWTRPDIGSVSKAIIYVIGNC